MPKKRSDKVRCPGCHKVYNRAHHWRHKESKKCAAMTYRNMCHTMGWWSCSNQIAGLLDKLKLNYIIQRKKMPNNGNVELHDLFVEGVPGILCQNLKARPLRWALKRLEDPKFAAAIDAVALLADGEDPTKNIVVFVEAQWKGRKGKHKNSDVVARRKKRLR